jgi:hypothetical protein
MKRIKVEECLCFSYFNSSNIVRMRSIRGAFPADMSINFP